MDQRYSRVSTIITTNLDLPDWYALFDKKPLVDALLDRLQHHCITIRIDGPSLRSPDLPATPPASPTRRTKGLTPAPDVQSRSRSPACQAAAAPRSGATRTMIRLV